MKTEYADSFITSVVSTFDTMLGCDLRHGEAFTKDGRQPELDVSGVIGLSGKIKGMLVLSLSREAALSAAEALLGERPEEIDADVADIVGELANVIAGVVKGELADLELCLGLPTVITGKGHAVGFPRGTTPTCIPFESDWGSITAEVELAEHTTDAFDTTN